MTSSLVKTWTSPVDFVQVFGDPPLATTERREDYDKLAVAITRAAKPADAIAALFVRDIIDITWEIQRERCVACINVPTALIHRRIEQNISNFSLSVSPHRTR